MSVVLPTSTTTSLNRVTHRYGWRRPSLPDQRDEYYRVCRYEPNLPHYVDLRHGFPEVYDQGKLGSCTSFAIGGAIQYDEMRQNIASPLPSFLFIYWNERKLENNIKEDSGASLKDGISVVTKFGVANDTCWPYDITSFAVRPPAACFADALMHRAIESRRVKQTSADIRGVLSEGFPVVFGITVYESFESEKVAKTGVVSMPKKTEEVLGGHALLLVGYNDTSRYFTVRNSWNKTFGDNGYIYLPYDYVFNQDLADEFWVIKRVSDGVVSLNPFNYMKMLYI